MNSYINKHYINKNSFKNSYENKYDNYNNNLNTSYKFKYYSNIHNNLFLVRYGEILLANIKDNFIVADVWGTQFLNDCPQYLLDNIEPCCGECNFMKRELSLNMFFDKLIKIKNNKLSHLKNINTELKCNNILLKANIHLDIEIYENEDIDFSIDTESNNSSSDESEIIFNNKINSKITKHLNKKTSEQIQDDIKLRNTRLRFLFGEIKHYIA